MGQVDLSDPFHSITAPPVNETAEERLNREDAEAKAKQISDKIDDILKKEKEARRKDSVIRILLLGQAESGKQALKFLLLEIPIKFIIRQIDHFEE